MLLRAAIAALSILALAAPARAQIGPNPSPPLNGLPGQPAGPLGPDGRVPEEQLTVSAFQYKGTWDASTNTPTLADGVGVTGDTYEIAVSGSQNLGGGTVEYLSGNLLLYNGTVWQQAGSGNIPVPANPTSQVGTSAVNGAAATFMRSDAAPAINQGISPTWTGSHRFNFTATATNPPLQLNSNNPQIDMRNTSAPANEQRWNWIASTANFRLRTLSDNGTTATDVFSVTRSGISVTGISTNSGSGPWQHTGDMAVSGAVSVTGTVSAAAPVNASDLATKEYVDSTSSGGLTQLPVFNRLNSPVNNAKIIVGRSSLVGGVGTVTLNNGSAFSNVEYECTANNMSSPAPVQVEILAADSFRLTSTEIGTGMYICIGN